ncbi:sigma-70 family RNA polymerase sigma factor [Polyangium sp. 15x6]|uniref:RNA polymerase sigma factor n=1 Tax=Polyangium sp. 15x6 TaxID=3042687 RepID=UPI00249AEF7F|nr:sigma-70 family RNA polymerase sigma factor [Polyangium sp. 15x6]MDI3286660.1 sigma-70 family RNA polymerase sigma factor [Polyangium sp. 15x6]
MARTTIPSPLTTELVALRPEVARILQRRSDALATDRMQELMLRGLAALFGYTPHPDGVRPWLFGIAKNLRSEEKRRARREREHFCPDLGDAERTATPDVSPEEGAFRSEARRALLSALKTLSPEQFIVIVLVDLAECTCSEAAELLDIPLGTVKSRLAAARTNMLRALGPKEQYLGALPIALFHRRALARRVFDYVYPYGHLLLASLFFALYRPVRPEAPAVATGAAHVIGASAADLVRATEVSGPPTNLAPVPAPPTPPAPSAASPDPFVAKPSGRGHRPFRGKGWAW